MNKILFVLDNEVIEVKNIHKYGYGVTIDCSNGCEYIVFPDHETAGEAAKEYWVDMAHNDKKEFTCLVGEQNLISWCLGESAGPGYSKVNSLDEWFDLWLDAPEEQWAGYDGEEIEGIQCNYHFLTDILDDDQANKNHIVLYRCN